MANRGRPRDFNLDMIVEAAMKTFWQNGYEACSTQALCEITGLGKGSLYNTFGSKHELFKQALERYHEIGIEQQRELLGRPDSAQSRLQDFLQWAVTEDYEPSEQQGCMLINAGLERQNDPVVQNIFSRHFGLLREAVLRVMEEGISGGEISSNRSVEHLTDSFLAGYYGLRVLNVSVKNRLMSEQTLQGVLSSIFYA